MSRNVSGDAIDTPPVKSAVPEARARALRPRDAATLILVDRTAALPRVLLGRRRADMKFMPGKYVFPGGRVDKSDRRMKSADELAEHDRLKLLFDMKGGSSLSKARALALAAVRETYEEAGIIIGAPHGGRKAPSDASWRRFFEQGFMPTLSPLTFFARAITPPGRPRRFDTRFFCADASAISFRGTPLEDELSDLVWMGLEEARSLDLPPITRVILEDLGDRMRVGPIGTGDAPVPYYFHRNGTFRRQLIESAAEQSSA
ncbi:MAG: NUDIX hydrolase [Hyphomicrobiaceae bacterium]